MEAHVKTSALRDIICLLRMLASSFFPGFLYSDCCSHDVSCHLKVTMSVTMMVMLMLMVTMKRQICIILCHLQTRGMVGRERKTNRCREEE